MRPCKERDVGWRKRWSQFETIREQMIEAASTTIEAALKTIEAASTTIEANLCLGPRALIKRNGENGVVLSLCRKYVPE